MGAFSVPVDVDSGARPYANSHTLNTTSLCGFSGFEDHVITASDATPLDAR